MGVTSDLRLPSPVFGRDKLAIFARKYTLWRLPKPAKTFTLPCAVVRCKIGLTGKGIPMPTGGFASKIALLIGAVLCWTLASSNTQPEAVRVVSFDPPGSILTQPSRINGSGYVTGSYELTANVYHGFLLEPNGTMLSFDPPGSTSTFSFGINSSGTTTGNYFDTHEYGFVRDAQGNYTTFDASVGGSGFGTSPVAINDSGQVVGSSKDANNSDHGFLRESNGNIVTFDPPGSTSTGAADISLDGKIVGTWLEGEFSAFLRDQSGTITTFRVPPSFGTAAESINRSGQVAGFYYDRNLATHGFIRNVNGKFTTFDAPGGGTHNSQGTIATSINDIGEVTGWVISSQNSVQGFLRDAGGTITVFNARAAGTGMNQGTYPLSINLSGATTGSYVDARGVFHGFLAF